MHSQTQLQIGKVHSGKRLFSEMTLGGSTMADGHKVTHFKYSSHTANIKIYNQTLANVRFLDPVSDFSLGMKKDNKENRDNKKVKSTEELILDEFKKHKFKAKSISKSLFSQRANITYYSRQRKAFPSKDAKTQSTKFKASPLPSLSVMEVRRSERPLTIAHSPHLRTKERSMKREEKASHLNSSSTAFL